MELIGKDAPRIAASNSVSIYAEPEWKDTYGNKYQWPIRHMLLTPDPRIPGLKGFMPIAANNTTIHVPVLRYQSNGYHPHRPEEQWQTRPPAPGPRPVGRDERRRPGRPRTGRRRRFAQRRTGSTFGDLAAEPEAKGTKDLKAHIKEHFLDKAHTVLDDEEMEHLDKLEAIKELLAGDGADPRSLQGRGGGGAGERADRRGAGTEAAPP